MSNLTIDKVLETVNREAAGKTDYVTNINNLHMDSKGRVSFVSPSSVNVIQGQRPKDVNFNTTDWAKSQLFGKLRIPAEYAKRLGEEAPELLADQFNHFAKKTDAPVMVRGKIAGNDGLIRGIVSDKYSMLDNDMTTEGLAKILKLGASDSYTIEDFKLDDTFMHLRIVFDETAKVVREMRDGRPDIFKLGMDIGNSEVGSASYSISSLLFRLVCTNGLKRWVKNEDDGDFSQRHIHLRTHEFAQRAMEAMNNSLRAGVNLMQDFTNTMSTRVENPFKVIEQLAAQNKFSKDFADKAKTRYEGDKNAYGVINSFTAAARDLSPQARLDMEKFAGKLISIAPKQWQRLDKDDDVFGNL